MRKLARIAIFGLLAVAAFAQTAQTGRVADTSGGVVPSAEVTA